MRPHDYEYLKGKTMRLTLARLLFMFLLPMASAAQDTAREGEAVREIIRKAEDHYRAGVVLNPQGKAAEATKQFDASEIKLGVALAAQYDRQSGVGPTTQSKQIETYLQGVTDRLATHASRKGSYRIHYDPYPAFKSAFALPGGHIIFGGGILALMNSEDELAAVIAHEIIHTDSGQVSDRVARLAKEQGVSPSDFGRWKVEDFGRSYTKQQELACDSGGARLAVKAGYSPFGLLHLLRTFQLLALPQPDSPPDRLTLAERIMQIQDEIRMEGWEGLTRERPLALP